MRRVSALLGIAAVGLWSVSALAQAKPNFSGKWVMEAPAQAAGGPPPGGGRGGGRGGWGMENTITQDANTLTVDYMGGGRNPGPIKLTYKLDGSESKNTVGQNEQVSKATWDGSKLVITTTTQFGETKRVLSLEGGNLVIETTTPGREGGTPTTTKVTYKKA